MYKLKFEPPRYGSIMVLVMRYMNPDQFVIRNLSLVPDKNKLCVIDTSINMLVLSYILSIIIDSINKFKYTDIESITSPPFVLIPSTGLSLFENPSPLSL